MKIGVVNFQGGVSEHLSILKKLVNDVVLVRYLEELKELDGLVIPGGESTTISLFLKKRLLDGILEKAADGMGILGTCAGCIILAKEVIGRGEGTLKLMNMRVERNAFGRQKESFEAFLDISGLENKFHGVFIRAPVIKEVWGDCKALAKLDNKIVMAREKNFFAVSFHPELTDDIRIHKMFVESIK